MSITGSFKILQRSDLEWTQVISLDGSHFPRPWSEDDWIRLNLDHNKVFVQILGEEVVAFALLGAVSKDEAAHLLKIFSVPPLRGSGESHHFFESIKIALREDAFKKIFLEVEMTNSRAIRFYEKMGFKTLRLMKGFYSDGADAQTMELTL